MNTQEQDRPSPALTISKTSDQVQDLVELLLWREEYQGDRAAFRFVERNLKASASDTYGSLAASAREIARYLKANGVGNEPVLLAYPAGLGFVRALWGILLAGAIAVPTYPPANKRGASLLAHVLKDSGARFVLCEETVRDASEAGVTWLSLPDSVSTEAASLEIALPGADAPAIIQYTSGSVENPKGVLLSHRNVLANSRLIHRSFFHTSKSRGFIWLPPYHDMGLIGGILQPVYGGFLTTLTSPRTFLRDPINWLAAITQTRATTSGGPNFAYQSCLHISDERLREAGIDLSSWQVAFNGAERVNPETIKAFIKKYGPFGFEARRFMACYGLAESTLYVASAHKLRKPSFVAVDEEGLRKNEVRLRESSAVGIQILTGHGFPGPGLKIVHPEELRVCRPNEVGEIWISGDSVAKSYWRRPGETAAVFDARLPGDATRYTRTGDLGFIHRAELYVTGRLKDLMIFAGRNHYPQDIEATAQNTSPFLERGAGAAFSIAAGARNEEERLVLVQEIARDADGQMNFAPILEGLRIAVFEHHGLSISEVVLVAHGMVPRTRSGKIRRNGTRQMHVDSAFKPIAFWAESADAASRRTVDRPDTASETAPPLPDLRNLDRSEASTVLLDWMRRSIAFELHTPLEELDPDLHFGLYGLDSLVAVKMTSLLSQALSLELDDALFWDYPNFNLLNTYLIDRFFSAGRTHD